MILLSIDPGRNMGFAIFDSVDKTCPCKLGVMRHKDKDYDEVLKNTYNNLLKLINMYKPDIVGFESGFIGANRKVGMKLSEFRGLLKCICIQKDISYYEISPSDVKKMIAGKGNAKKHIVAECVSEITGINSFETDDVSDAIAIGLCYFKSFN